MRFVIFLLGLRRLQLAPDLSSAQFILSSTTETELVNVRTPRKSSRSAQVIVRMERSRGVESSRKGTPGPTGPESKWASGRA